MRYELALYEIYSNLLAGCKYGYTFANVRYPFFNIVLSHGWSRGKEYAYWHNAGSSANEFTLSDLNWIIRTIFNLTPTQFKEKFTCMPA